MKPKETSPKQFATLVKRVFHFLENIFLRANFQIIFSLKECFFSKIVEFCRVFEFSSGFISSIFSILPSSKWMIWSLYLYANSLLWVTTTTRCFADISFNIFVISRLFSESNAPVGSSAKIIVGSLTKLLAIATRWACPPLSSLGYLFLRSNKPTSFNNFSAFSLTSFFEREVFKESGKETFS